MQQWLGTKRVAFFPVYRRNQDVVPSNWVQQIESRLYWFNTKNADYSLRTYLNAISHGRADIDAVVFDPIAIDQPEIPVAVFASRKDDLVADGFDAGAIVVNSGAGAGSAEVPGFWARFDMAEAVGTWMMELTHALTGLEDLRHIPGADDIAVDLGCFDNMAFTCSTHLTAYSKLLLGWLDPSSITQHTLRRRVYQLHDVSLRQPPPAGRATAVQVGSEPPLLMVEARERTDQFDAGVPMPGVIAYEVMEVRKGGGGSLRPIIELRSGAGAAVQPGGFAVSSTGVSVTVLQSLSGGYTVQVTDPSRFVEPLSAELGVPNPASSLMACVLPDSYTITYRSASGDLYEMWRATNGTNGSSALTTLAGASKATGTAYPYLDTARNTVILLFRATNGVVRSLYWSTGPVTQDDLGGYAHAPRAAGNPIGFYSAVEDMHRVYYRGTDGLLHEMWWQGVAPVQYSGTLNGSAPHAVGDPAGYIDTVSTNKFVIYRGTNGHIYSLYWTFGAAVPEDLSGYAGTPRAIGDPQAYHTAADNRHTIVYRARDGHLYELAWYGSAPVVGRNLTQEAGTPKAASDPSIYFDAHTGTRYVVYRSADGTLWELSEATGWGLSHRNITLLTGAPRAQGRPVAFTVPWLGSQHVAYQATNGKVYEITR
jgi:hypothetical protein